MLKDACVSSIPSAPRAFYYCGSLGRLTSISLPDGLTSIGNQAFSGCESLALTSLPDGLTSIGDYTFYKCTSLALTSLPDGLTSIGYHSTKPSGEAAPPSAAGYFAEWMTVTLTVCVTVRLASSRLV